MSKMRLIDANALLKECEKRQEQQTYEYCDCFLNDAQEISTEWWCVEDMVMAAPTIDTVPVVHARWVHEQRYGDSGGWVWRCSACRRESITCIISAMKYCHACGAKMDAEKEST